MRVTIDTVLHPTNHADIVVTPPDQLFMMWPAVNCLSRASEVIGANQRITPLESLKARNNWATEQYEEEESKRSLEVGKLADLVILDQNPLVVDPVKIKYIKVVETVKERKTIYRR